MDVVWLPVSGFSDYAVSNDGRVMRTAVASNGRKPAVLKSFLGNHLYETVGLQKDGKTYKKLVHRLVCEAFHGPPPSPEHHVAHGDGTRTNHRPENLRWATRSENMADCVEHGTRAMGAKHGRTTKPEKTPRGERHGHAKLTESDVLAIRSSQGKTGRALAVEYGVDPATICMIRSGKIWRHI